MYLPENDGQDHINCYSKGRTKLGRDLSNWAKIPFRGKDGYFASVEAYWYWLSCSHHSSREALRYTTGFAAKKLGREFCGEDYPTDPTFKPKILEAVHLKIEQNPVLKKAFIESTLPFTHYYVFGGKIHRDTRSDWLWDYLIKLREEFKITG